MATFRVIADQEGTVVTVDDATTAEDAARECFSHDLDEAGLEYGTQFTYFVRDEGGDITAHVFSAEVSIESHRARREPTARYVALLNGTATEGE